MGWGKVPISTFPKYGSYHFCLHMNHFDCLQYCFVVYYVTIILKWHVIPNRCKWNMNLMPRFVASVACWLSLLMAPFLSEAFAPFSMPLGARSETVTVSGWNSLFICIESSWKAGCVNLRLFQLPLEVEAPIWLFKPRVATCTQGQS